MRTLRWQITLGVAALVFLALLAFSLRFYQVTLDWTRTNALDLACDKAVRFGRWVPAERPVYTEELRLRVRNEAQGYHAAILGPDGQWQDTNASRLFPRGDFNVPATYRADPDACREPCSRIVRAEDGQLYAAAWYPLGHHLVFPSPPLGWTVAAVPLKNFDQRAADLRGQLVARTVGITVSVTTLAFLLASLWTQPLMTVADTAEQLAQGDLSLERLALPRGDSELRRLVAAFNVLLDRLRELHAVQRRFVAEAAHELRTPLTILRGEIQVALRRPREAARYQDVLQSNLEEVLRLSRLVENLLTLARVDAGQPLSAREPIFVGEFCETICQLLRSVAASAGVHLRVEADDRVCVDADRLALERVLTNLLQNAIRHSTADDEVVVRVSAADRFAKLEVMDHGCGIGPEHLPHLFERFYRVDSARNGAQGGAGLGLAIVKSLTEAQGGSVEVRSEVGRGSVFTLTLPLVFAADAPGATPSVVTLNADRASV